MSGNCSFLLKPMKKPSKVKIKVTALNPLSLLPLKLTDIVFASVSLFHVIYTKDRIFLNTNLLITQYLESMFSYSLSLI